MSRNLSNMSLEELWRLFPVFLTEHKSYWYNWYKDEKLYIEKILPIKYVKRISHIGSTYIDTIQAKPIIDILLETTKECELNEIKKTLPKMVIYACQKALLECHLTRAILRVGLLKKCFIYI